MAEIALIFVGVGILVLLLLLVASIVYVPKALGGHDHDDEEHDSEHAA